MPNETDGPSITDEQMDRAMSDFQDESYLRGLPHRQEMADHDRFMDDIVQHREELETEAAQQQTTDFQAILKDNVSKSKMIPIEQLTEGWAKKEEAAQREAELRPTTLEAARLEQFGGKLPVFHEGQIIEVIDPNQKEEQVREVRKGTSSHHVHHPKTSRSTVVWRPKGPKQRDTRDADRRVKDTYAEIDGFSA